MIDERLLRISLEADRPPPRMDLDEWADRYRFMSETTGEKWYTKRVEVARGPMKAVTEPGVHTITAMVATQMLKTELLMNVIGYFSHLDPCPILVVQPKTEVAKKFSNVRVKQMVKSSPVLRERYIESRQRDATDTTLHKEFPGGHLTIVSAKTPSDLAMLPIRIVLLDEIDKYDESAGKEGDPINLAEERMSKYASNSLAIRTCSPTIKNLSRIEASYETSDMRKPYVPCPLCGHHQVLLWPNVRWQKDGSGRPILNSTMYHCTKCQAGWTEFQRLTALRRIVWHQTREFDCRECGVVNAPLSWDPNDLGKWNKYGHAVCEGCQKTHGPNQHAGFWANKLYSPFRSLSHLVKLWTEAQGNIESLKTFINTQLAETFEQAGEQIRDIDWLTARMEQYDGALPSGAGLITAGVDVQNHRIEVEVVAWGKDEESWSIDHVVIPGDLSQPEIWLQLDDVLSRPYARHDGRISYAAAVAIDMQGGFTQQVAEFCRTRGGRRWWAIRGMGGEGRPIPVWPNNPGRTKHNIPFYNVGVDAAKNVIFSRLFVEKAGPGYCHFPIGRPKDWFKQLVAERRVVKHRGTQKYLAWENPSHSRNEAFDMRVYAYAALCGLQSLGWKLNNLVVDGKCILPPEFDERRRRQREAESKPYTKPAEKVINKRRVVKSDFMSR